MSHARPRDHNLFACSLGQWQDGPHDVVAADPKFAAIPGGEGPPSTPRRRRLRAPGRQPAA